MSTVKLRISGAEDKKTYHIGLPASLGRQVDEAHVQSFEVVATEDGILLRPIFEMDEPELIEVPSWLQGK